MRVLLATDRADLGHALCLYLKECRVDVIDVVCDSDRLVERAAAERPDVILIDWQLGEAVSTEAVADLQSGDDPTPVVMLSSSGESGSARTSGAAAYATLSDHPDSLLAILDGVARKPL